MIVNQIESNLTIDTNKIINNTKKYSKTPFSTPKYPKFKFIDLFAGIGGFRIALQNLGGLCVFSSEWDKKAQQTYQANFGEIQKLRDKNVILMIL